MSFNDILDLFKQGKASAKSHMRNLIEIAAADGQFAGEEQRLLQYAALRNNISEAELSKIQADASSVRFHVPRNEVDKFTQLYDLVHMMTIDQQIHDEELRLCEIFAIKFGYRKEGVREMSALISVCIKERIGPKETMKKVMGEMKVYE